MSDIQTIKDRLDIVQLIQEYIPLKKSGVHWKGCCPFHNEKTPSFMVQPDKQFFHCFGCNSHGDVITFVEKMEGLEFIEALRLLAERAGVKMDTFKSDVNKSEKNRILEINKKAAFFFHSFLMEMQASVGARKYLEDRGVDEPTIKKWQVGFVPNQWDLLTKYLLKKGIGIEDIVKTGLAIKKDQANPATGKGYYDRFRGRIMFPISDVHGNVVGFTGRVLVEDEKSGGKYVNTPQTLVFDKSNLIYGLDRAKQAIRSADKVVLVEGQMDVIACHQAGMENVVAASGTALTEQHVKMLKRYTKNIAIAFDADQAGIKASKRGIQIAMQQGMNINVIQIPDGAGKDADECLKKNKQVWFTAVEQADEVMDWFFDIYLKDLDLNDPKSKQIAASSILTEIVNIPYAIEREHWLKKLAGKINVDVSALKEDMQTIKRQVGLLQREPVQVSMPPEANPVKKPIVSGPTDRFSTDLENIICLIAIKPVILDGYINRIKGKYFEGTDLSELYEIIISRYNKDNKFNYEEIEKDLSSEIQEKYCIIALKAEEYYGELDEREIEQELDSILTRLDTEYKKRQLNKQLINS